MTPNNQKKKGGKIGRRNFLKITGLGAAAAIGPEAGYRAWWKIWNTPDGTGDTDWQKIPKGPETFKETVCRQCPGTCGAIIRTIKTPDTLPDIAKLNTWDPERLVKIDGNPSHPVSKGAMCPKGQTALQMHYNPDRLRTPLKKVGPNEFQEITWNQAIQEITNHLTTLRNNNKPHTAAVLDGSETPDSIHLLIKRFLDAYGSPNHVTKPPATRDEQLHIDPHNPDKKGYYNLNNAQYILSFDHNFVDASHSPVETIQAYSHLKENDAKITYIGSRLSVTGIKSHEWIPVIPGTEAMLALGIAKSIITNNLHNTTYINNNTTGFPEYQNELQKHTFKTISETTAVPIDTIHELAHEFATHGTDAIALGNNGTAAAEHAIATLNLLTGSTEKHFHCHDTDTAIPFTTHPETTKDTTAQNGLNQTPLQTYEDLIDAALYNDPYPVNTLFLYHTNPILSTPNPNLLEKALNNIDLVVTFSPFLDETAQHSDLILPDHSPFERLQDAPHTLLDGTPVLTVQKPVTKPRYNTKHTGDVLIQIMHSIGGTTADAAPWNTYTDYLTTHLRGIYESGEGEIINPVTQNDLHFYHRFRGTPPEISTSPTSLDEWIDAAATTAWWNPRNKQTPTGTATFNTDIITGKNDNAENAICPDMIRKEHVEYSYCLNVYKMMSVTKPRNTTQPSLFNLGSPQIAEKWDAWVEINPKIAERQGIHDGDWVWLEAPNGEKQKFRAKHYKGTWPIAVNVPLNIGAKGYGKYRKQQEQNPMRLIDIDTDPEDGRLLYNTRVKLYKA